MKTFLQAGLRERTRSVRMLDDNVDTVIIPPHEDGWLCDNGTYAWWAKTGGINVLVNPEDELAEEHAELTEKAPLYLSEIKEAEVPEDEIEYPDEQWVLEFLAKKPATAEEIRKALAVPKPYIRFVNDVMEHLMKAGKVFKDKDVFKIV